MASQEPSFWNRMRKFLEYGAAQPSFDLILLAVLIAAEFGLSKAIVRYVPYTEIDWEAYMQEVEFYLNGERDYLKMYGGTGPLVYPAGFVYLFAGLRKLTLNGTNIAAAQHIFVHFYVVTQAIVLVLYIQVLPLLRRYHNVKAIWSWRIAIGCLCLSKRLHSIYLLRLFNDGPTMLLFYLSVYMFTRKRWNIGCFIFSLAVSLKMNVLLAAPGLLLLLLQVGPNWQTVIMRLGLGCALPQLILGAPFLTTHPISYLRKAFELDRVFFYKWTVNFKCISEELFLSKPWALLLLALHLGTLGYCAVVWCRACRRVTGKSIFLQYPLSGHYICYTLMLSNFIGIVFARTLHYQFYCWYFHCLPYLLWTSDVYPLPIKVVILILIEGAFLTFPATPTSSFLLQVAHLAVLIPCIFKGPPLPIEDRIDKDKKEE